jgi:hypothetical protein
VEDDVRGMWVDINIELRQRSNISMFEDGAALMSIFSRPGKLRVPWIAIPMFVRNGKILI